MRKGTSMVEKGTLKVTNDIRETMTIFPMWNDDGSIKCWQVALSPTMAWQESTVSLSSLLEMFSQHKDRS